MCYMSGWWTNYKVSPWSWIESRKKKNAYRQPFGMNLEKWSKRRIFMSKTVERQVLISPSSLCGTLRYFCRVADAFRRPPESKSFVSGGQRSNKKNCNRHQSKCIFLSLLLRSIAILYSYSYAILKPHLYILSAIGSFTFWILTIHSIMFILQPYFVPGSVNEPCSRSWIFNAHKVPTRQPGWGDVRGLARHPSIVSLQAKHFTSMRFIFFFLAKNFLFWSKSTLTRRCIIFRYFYWSAFPVFGAGKRKKKNTEAGDNACTDSDIWHLT